MQKIKISKVESRPVKNGGTLVIITDDKGARFSGFIKDLQQVKEGDVIEAEIQVDGKFNNITSLKILEHPTTPPPTPVPGPPAALPPTYHGKTVETFAAELDSNYRKAALIGAIDLAKVGQIPVEKIPEKSLEFYLWLKNPGNKQSLPPAK